MFGKVIIASLSFAVSNDQRAHTLSSACATPQRSLYRDSSEVFIRRPGTSECPGVAECLSGISLSFERQMKTWPERSKERRRGGCRHREDKRKGMCLCG